MNEIVSKEELEHRMHPGQYSQRGFLGPNESLEEVIARDEQALATLGISCEQIASALERVIAKVREQEKTLPIGKRLEKQQDFPDLSPSEKKLLFLGDNLPALDQGYCVDSLQIFMVQWRGFQNCPWGCADRGSFDFMVLNRKTSEFFLAPALITHLIRAHHFFEGIDSPYRVEPERVVRVLEML